jgi:chromosome segregation ATPase
MLVGLLFLFIGISIGALMAWGYWLGRMRRHKEQMRQYAAKVEELTSSYDEYRRKYLDLDDQYAELKSQEQTYRVAYHEWKTKYEALKSDFEQLSYERESKTFSSEVYDSRDTDNLDDATIRAELERVRRALSQTTAQVDRQAEMIRLHNKQAERLEQLKGQLIELLDHGQEIAIKSSISKGETSDPRVTDINDH